MPDNEQTLIEKAGRVLSSASAQAVLDAFNATANAMNKLMELLQRAGIEQIAEEGESEEAPADEEAAPEEEVAAEDDAPPAEEKEDMPPDEDMMDEGDMEDEKMMMRPTQKEVNYVTLSTKKGAACANCRWFMASGHEGMGGAYCHLIDNWPEDILPTGYCDRHEGKPSMEEMQPEPIPVQIVEMQRDVIADYVTLAGRVKTVLRSLMKPQDSPDFSVFKDASGQWRWIARYTNNFQDLEGEIISEKALEDYVRRVDMGFVPMPTLRVWHIPNSDHGVAESVFGHGGFVYAVGTFHDTPEAKHAIAEYRKSKGKTRLSQGFTHPKWAFKDGVYQVMNTFEISTLPPGAAANPFTSFEEIQTMQINDAQRQYLEKTLGKEKADAILTTAEKDTEAIKNLGVAYKDFNATTPKPENAVPTEEQIVAKAFVDVVEAQSEVLRIVQAQEAEIKALKAAHETELKTANDTITALRNDLAAVQKTLSLAPRASQSAKTVLTEAEQAQVEKEIPRETESFWGALGVAKKDA